MVEGGRGKWSEYSTLSLSIVAHEMNEGTHDRMTPSSICCDRFTPYSRHVSLLLALSEDLPIAGTDSFNLAVFFVTS